MTSCVIREVSRTWSWLCYIPIASGASISINSVYKIAMYFTFPYKFTEVISISNFKSNPPTKISTGFKNLNSKIIYSRSSRSEWSVKSKFPFKELVTITRVSWIPRISWTHNNINTEDINVIFWINWYIITTKYFYLYNWILKS